MVFGTTNVYLWHQSLFQSNIMVTSWIMKNPTTYKYLGNQLDRNLNLDENFEWAYRKTSGWLHLLAKLRCHLTTLAAVKIFDMVIMPLLTYSSIINLKLTKTQSNKLLSPECRASRITGKKVKSIEYIIKIRAINMVYKVLMNDNVCENFNDYFAINYHAKTPETEIKYWNYHELNLNLPSDRLSTWGTILYNDLPLNIRACKNDPNFRKLFNDYVF